MTRCSMTSFQIPGHLHYTDTHEWVRMDANVATIGISDFAQDQLSDVVWVELPPVGETFEAGMTMATVESVKAAADIYAPCTGTVVAVNEALLDTPEAINQAPYSSWFVKLEVAVPDSMPVLHSPEAYQALTAA